MLNGFINFVVAAFDPSIFSDATYWLKTVTGSASGLAAFIIFAYMRRDSKILNDKDFIQDTREVNGIVRSEVGPDFPDFIAEKNLTSKIVKWKEKMENKLTKWHNKIPSRVLYNIKRLEEDSQWGKNIKQWRIFKKFFTKKAQSRAAKWVRKRDKLKLQLTEQWISKNIYYRKVRFPETTVGEIINGERRASSNRVINNGALGLLLRERMPVILLSVALQAAYHALAIQQVMDPAAVWMGIIFQLVTIFMNVGIGLNYGNTLFKKLDLNNLLTRKQYIMEYLIWKKQPKKVIKREEDINISQTVSQT